MPSPHKVVRAQIDPQLDHAEPTMEAGEVALRESQLCADAAPAHSDVDRLNGGKGDPARHVHPRDSPASANGVTLMPVSALVSCTHSCMQSSGHRIVGDFVDGHHDNLGAEYFIVEEKDQLYEADRVDANEGTDVTLYGLSSEGHTGHYTAEREFSSSHHDVARSTSGPASSGGASALDITQNGASSACQVAGAPRLVEDYDDDHYQGDLHEEVRHPFDLPPNCDELNGIPVEDGSLDAYGAAAGSDSLSVPVQGVAPVPEVRRRLTGKTSQSRAAELGHPPRAVDAPHPQGLVTRETARAARLRHREAKELHEGEAKRARSIAWLAIRRQPELTAASRHGEPADSATEDDHGAREVVAVDGQVPSRWLAHPSHNVAAAPGAQVVYCRRCGAWTTGERSSNLTRECSLKMGHKGNLRLLGLGITPRRGARVPAELKLAGARGTRGGTAVRRPKRRGAW